MRWLSRSFLLALLACGDTVDSDADGLDDKAEQALGTDPGNPDTDADGVSDGDEVELGLNPLSNDTDGDSYTDGDELFEQTDPADPESRIYTGGWPYVRDKSMFADPEVTAPGEIGDPTPRIRAMDQFGDIVDLADFGGDREEILISVCAVWNPVCIQLADWRGDGIIEHGNPIWNLGKERAREKVDADEAYWLTVMVQGPEYETSAAYEDVVEWAERYPNDNPVLWDEGGVFASWAQQHTSDPYFPTHILLRRDLSINHIDSDTDPTPFWAFNIFAEAL